MVSLYNLFTFVRIKRVLEIDYQAPFISVLVPARNEERGIRECVNSLCNQVYSSYEVLVLDRKLAERRIYPAIDVNRSSTRHDELLLTQEELARVWILRKVLSEFSSIEAMELLLSKLESTKDNREFLQVMNS